MGSRINGFGYELFQVSEERDEEVAAFCHMLDVYVPHARTRTDTRTVSACPPDKCSACSRLRTAYPWSDRSKNSGFIWSPSVGQEELHQGLGISVKVSVICEHFREPLTFTCDGESSTASCGHWLLPEVCRSRDGRKKILLCVSVIQAHQQ